MTFFIFMAIIEVENFIFCAIIMPEGSQNLKDLESRRTDLQKNLKDSRDKLSSTRNQLTVAQKQLDSDKQANQDEIKNFVENLMAQIE